MNRLRLAALLGTIDLGGLALGAWWLLRNRPGRRPSWLADGLRLAGLGTGLVLVAVLAGTGAGEPFLVLRLLCHGLFCVVLPLAGARALQRRGIAGGLVFALALLGEGAYLWARHVEPFRLQVRHETLASPRLAQSLRVAILSDLQPDFIGAYEARVFEALDALEADLVLIPGDLLQFGPVPDAARVHTRERDRLRALFEGLRHPPRLGFLMVRGDCEAEDARFDDFGLRMLADEPFVFPDEGLQVIGLSLAASRQPLAPALADAARAFRGLTIVLGHAPEFALSAPGVGVPLLCVAGHTHGGQVVFPFLGPPITLSSLPRRMAAGGFFPLGDSWLCLSRGLGMERLLAPRIRFLCPPELVSMELVPQAP